MIFSWCGCSLNLQILQSWIFVCLICLDASPNEIRTRLGIGGHRMGWQWGTPGMAVGGYIRVAGTDVNSRNVDSLLRGKASRWILNAGNDLNFVIKLLLLIWSFWATIWVQISLGLFWGKKVRNLSRWKDVNLQPYLAKHVFIDKSPEDSGNQQKAKITSSELHALQSLFPTSPIFWILFSNPHCSQAQAINPNLAEPRSSWPKIHSLSPCLWCLYYRDF